MSDKLYTAYGGDKIIDLENQNTTIAFKDAISGGASQGLAMYINLDVPDETEEKDGVLYVKYWAKDKDGNKYDFEETKTAFSKGVPVLIYEDQGELEGFLLMAFVFKMMKYNDGWVCETLNFSNDDPQTREWKFYGSSFGVEIEDDGTFKVTARYSSGTM